MRVELCASVWRKSSFSGGGNNCVELASLADAKAGVRDSTRPESGALVVDRAVLRRFLAVVRRGEL